jgi:putative membrane protein
MMMNGWSGSMSAWDWVWLVIALAAAGAVAAAGIGLMVRSLRRELGAPAIEPATRASAPRSSAAAVPSAEDLLADRFARGEIGEDEYWQRVHTLRAADRR